MSQSSLTIRIDDELKAEFLEVCDSMGVPATTALTVFVKRVVRDRRIPFDVTAEPKRTILGLLDVVFVSAFTSIGKISFLR